MSRLSAVVLNLGAEDAPIIEVGKAAAQEADMAFAWHSGRFEDLCRIVRDWSILPEILVVDVPGELGPAETLQRLGDSLPEGETEIILYNVPNDISIYRALKSEGVREIFSGVPSDEELTEALTAIRDASVKQIGIDPRRAVYVFSACGGAGGTAFATSIARRFNKLGRRTLFIDMDISTGAASFMFNAEKGARETNGLLEILGNSNRIDALFLERTMDRADKNLWYLSARRRASDPIPTPKSLPILVSRAQQNFDMVVVDIPWRVYPETDYLSVQGTSYIVAPPTPAGLLGFSILSKELDAAPGKLPRYGIINRKGEFKGNDLERPSFREASSVELFMIPYDAAAAGRMFFEQKSFLEMPGKIKKAADRIMKTLPGAVAESEGPKARPGRGREDTTTRNKSFFLSLFSRKRTAKKSV